MSVSVCQIRVTSEPQRTFFLKLDSGDDLGAGFVLVLCDGVSAWGGEVSEEDVTREARELEMEREKYVEDLWLALAGKGQKGDHTFHLSSSSPNSGTLHLSYEKVQKNISFRLGLVELQELPEPVEVVKDLIIHGLEKSTKLQATNEQLEEENEMLRREQTRITSELERYVQGKELLERDLYSRFVLVLNEKKAKMRRQQEEIKQLQDKLEELREAALEKKKAPHWSAGSASISPPIEDTYGASTDEEGKESPPRSLAPEQPIYAVEEPGPASVDDNLHDITDVAPCRRRRQRHLQGPSGELKKEHGKAQKKRKESTEDKTKMDSKVDVFHQPAAKTADHLEADKLFDDM
ncbi:DNA repair protein XRCC4 isoform X2 [Scleropages formosus]|uniref:X-ray repair complementing defective repair in Chinese hamster cells 4 n=3 Tax=Scleropages formosus TaxID=113540 RepID=A0A8C9RFF8_SCLFO|nr:DNA repair protein XRCC4 isoform X2 [Scleropages formosus]XP_018600576.1 DNA repair protein XRCC4 isoform X2 [Scleropages formosus]XP_018600577.1 DNA repair protein XRCC4 isoform X2 [Scleropages formosus]